MEHKVDEKNTNAIENILNKIPTHEINNFEKLIMSHCDYIFNLETPTNPEYLYNIIKTLTNKITIINRELSCGNVIIDRFIIDIVKSEKSLYNMHNILFPAFEPVAFYKLACGIIVYDCDSLEYFDTYDRCISDSSTKLMKNYIYQYHKNIIEHKDIYDTLLKYIDVSDIIGIKLLKNKIKQNENDIIVLKKQVIRLIETVKKNA